MSEEKKQPVGIVSSKYAGKLGADSLAKFVAEECKDDQGKQDHSRFFKLCRANGLPEEKVSHYEEQVLTEKRKGAPGRARMTLRNMLAGKLRNEGYLFGNDGIKYPIDEFDGFTLNEKKAKAKEAEQAAE